MVKQAVDARHLRGKRGGYVAFAGRDEPTAVGAEVGMIQFGEPWTEARVGLATLVHDGGDHPVSGGLSGSLRLQTPTRLAPFVGIGAYGGYAGLKSADDDGRDNDNDGSIDERGEDESAWAGAVFPEAGVHFWINHRVRATASASYYVTNQGRNDDFLFYSVGIAFLGREYERERHAPAEDKEVASRWSFLSRGRRDDTVLPSLWHPQSLGPLEGPDDGNIEVAESPYGKLRFE
jgi:hypothetical protein